MVVPGGMVWWSPGGGAFSYERATTVWWWIAKGWVWLVASDAAWWLWGETTPGDRSVRGSMGTSSMHS